MSRKRVKEKLEKRSEVENFAWERDAYPLTFEDGDRYSITSISSLGEINMAGLKRTAHVCPCRSDRD